MKNKTCPKCNNQQLSIMDNHYLDLYSQCWGCDKIDWGKGKLSLEEFERREQCALDKELDGIKI